MSKILFGTLIAWLVTSCNIEEPNDSGVLVDSSSEVDVPDWITPAHLDLNKDGIVNILDLVIHSKFMGQEVAEPTIASSGDGSDPCQDIKAKRYDNLQVVDGDNADMTETFSTPNGNYVYALIALQQYNGPECFAVRILVDDNLSPTAVVVKSVPARDEFSSSVLVDSNPQRTQKTYPHREVTETYHEWKVGNTYYNGSPRKVRSYSNYSVRTDQDKLISLTVDFDFILDSFDIDSYPEEDRSGIRKWKNNERQEYYAERLTKSGIPIGGDRIISKIAYGMNTLHWRLGETHKETRCSLNKLLSDTEQRDCDDAGAYLKMLPAEVRRRYFPEDIDN